MTFLADLTDRSTLLADQRSARAETQHLLQMIRANEVAVEQLKQLEGQVVEERRERQELRARLEKEETGQRLGR